jgi:hypothetical protein
MPDELPEGYYLANFHYLIEFVSKQYAHLLTPDENLFFKTFGSLNEDEQRLFVRLSNRQGPFFRLDKLVYPEITSVPATVELLIAAKLLVAVIPDQEEALKLCAKDELLQLELIHMRPAGPLPGSIKKSELCALIRATACNPIEALDVPVVEVLAQDYLILFRLLFFGNFHQGMTDFVLHELVAPFERYELSGEACMFQNRVIVDELILLKQLSEASYELIEIDDTGDEVLQLLDALRDRPSEPILARRFDKTVNRIARHLERLGRNEDALSVYARTVATPSRERRARLFAKSGNVEKSVSLCANILEDPLDESELEFANTFGMRTAKKHALPFSGEPTARSVNQTAITVPRLSDSVEDCAVQFYRQQGISCYYVENTLLSGLFGLCFWDIVFSPVPGAFFNPLQRGPADLYTSDFTDNREALILARLEQISADGVGAIVRHFYQEKFGVANPFVSWSYLDKDLLEQAIKAIPVNHLVKIFERLLVDIKNNRSGFPDLILFLDGGYKLVEIKGPGDRLQKNQARWFRYFYQQGIPAEVVDVTYS